MLKFFYLNFDILLVHSICFFLVIQKLSMAVSFFFFFSFLLSFVCLPYSSPQSFLLLLLLCPFQSSSFERFARLIGCKWYYRLSLFYIITYYSVLFICIIYFLHVCWFDGIILFPSKGYSKGKLAYCLSGRDNRVHRFIQRSRSFVK